jgi:D-alanyl-D-alanine carboxypeptidase/D-alanyl-D-alanine-endopeptidase (penicillin-binding protein 4)
VRSETVRGARAACVVLSAACALAWTPQATELDQIFADPILTRALVGVRIESLTDGRVIYQRDSAKLVMPASNMKLHTLAVAAERLGWDFRYETRLEAAGAIDPRSGILNGDLVVVGSGDPSIMSLDFLPAPVFGEWADALWKAGVRQVTGRLIGDDRAFADEPLGPGWAWDYLDAGYAAPSGALSYNENTVNVRAWPGDKPGAPVRVEVSPAGHGLDVANELVTGVAGSGTRIELLKPNGQPRLTLRGALAAGGAVVTRVTTIDRPAQFFADGLLAAFEAR